MHLHRLRYLVFGLLIHIQSAFCRTCGSDFEDVPSRTIRSDIVFEGKVMERHESFHRDGYYNATMKVKKLLKGTLPKEPFSDKYKILLVGIFGTEDREKCIYDIGVGTYVIFLDGHNSSSLDPNVPFYRISAFPEPSSSTIKKTVRKYRCAKCGKAPKARVIPREQEVQLGRKIQLRCKVSGRPSPDVRWLKDSQPVEKNDRIEIKLSRRSSRLKIRHAKAEDEGVYTCEVSNVVGTNYRDVQVSVTDNSSTDHPAHAEPCSEGNAYCLNGGRCYRVINLGTRFCQCTTFWHGPRCMDRHLPEDIDIPTRRIRIKEAHHLDRALTIAGLAITALVLGGLILAAYLMSKKKRKAFQKKQAAKRKAALSANVANGANGPVSVETTCPSERKKQEKPLMFNQRTEDRGAQTEEMMNAPFLGIAAIERAASMSNRRSIPNLPHQHTAPSLLHSSSEPMQPTRSRLSAISATPDISLDFRRQPNVSVVNAVVESDPEQHSKRSSPSQSSKTESAHANLDQANSDLHKGLFADDTDLGSKGDLSLDLDQRSDYDNAPPSDMEVNLESEADIHGLDASGDELDGHGMNTLSGRHVIDSTDSDSEDSTSSIGEERALFHNLQSNPRVRHLQQNANYTDKDSSGNLSWDGYQSEPSFAMDRRYYNPYALDNDIIANRYFQDGRSNRSSAHEKITGDYEMELPYDPDPDATVV